MTARPLRITQVVVTDGFAGTERYVVDVSTELARRGHDVRVVGGDPPAMRRLLPAGVRWQPGATAPRAVAALARGGRRDIVHSHITKADFAGALAAAVTGGQRFSTRHITARRGYTPAAARIGRLVRRRLSGELAVSTYVAGTVESSVDAVVINGVRPRPDVSTPRTRTVLVAQRLAPEKRTALALSAWRLSGLAADGWVLIIAGDGPERETLAAEAARTAGVRLIGWVEDVDELLRTASILFAPAPAEPCGLTVLEAMSYGLPVIAPASGGVLETVGREPAAALFTPGDANAAAAQLRRLADDPAARAAYGSALRSLQRREFTLSGHVDRLERIYRDAVAAR